MKYITFLLDGFADYSISELDGMTPMEYAKTPNMDSLAKNAVFGTFLSLPAAYPTSSDVANLSVLGWELSRYYTGRGAIECYGAGYEMTDETLAFRLNLVTVTNGSLTDYSAGHLTNEEASILMDDLSAKLGTDEILFRKGVSYRNLLLLLGKKFHHDIDYSKPDSSQGLEWKEILPKSNSPLAKHTETVLKELVFDSLDLLKDHPVNKKRLKEGKNPANLIWPWSGGRKPNLPSFSEMFSKQGAVVSAVDVILGIGKLGKMQVLKPDGATGFIDTNYENKAIAGCDLLEKNDFVYLHLEGIDECSHMGELDKKIQAIEDADSRLIGTFLTEYKKRFDEPLRIMVLPDHPVPISLRAHTRDKVPFMISGSKIRFDADIKLYNEKTCLKGKYCDLKNRELMDLFFQEDEISHLGSAR